MPIQLRQIALVAERLEPVIEDLTEILGIERCYVDPGVGYFGLENTLMAIGRNFLEVVAPVKENTAAGRYLQRRQGDGGYMVITQADSQQTQSDAIQRALDAGIRIAHETIREDWHLCQLHPGDLKTAFLEIESDQFNDFNGHWMPVGGTGWEDKVNQTRTIDITGVELQGENPWELAESWGNIIGAEPARTLTGASVALNNATLQFVPIEDGRGPGLSGLHIQVRDRPALLEAAKQRGCYINDQQVSICGVHWYLN